MNHLFFRCNKRLDATKDTLHGAALPVGNPVLASSSWTIKFIFDLVALVVGMGVGADFLVVIFLKVLVVF
jgi:hypothetical protein